MERDIQRLDVLLIEKGIVTSRERAKESILEGKIYVNGKVEKKCGKKFCKEIHIQFKGEPLKYVSRGGLKLEKAINKFNININNKITADIGASTGGFTHCMLLNGAIKVFAVDVGRNQLHKSLKENEKVLSYEETNVRDLKEDCFGETIEFASIDVSFISLKKVIKNVINILSHKGEIVALIKPQFEAGKKFLNKKGVVKDKNIHKQVVMDLFYYFQSLDLRILGFDYSPITGPNGNIEYLIYMSKDLSKLNRIFIEDVENIISYAFNTLK